MGAAYFVWDAYAFTLQPQYFDFPRPVPQSFVSLIHPLHDGPPSACRRLSLPICACLPPVPSPATKAPPPSIGSGALWPPNPPPDEAHTHTHTFSMRPTRLPMCRTYNFMVDIYILCMCFPPAHHFISQFVSPKINIFSSLYIAVYIM